MFKQLFTKIFKCSQKPMLGRWNLSKCYIKENITVLNTNRDHCGDPKEQKKFVDQMVNKD